MIMFVKHLRNTLLASIAVLVISINLLSLPAIYSDTYGSGDYGSCNFGNCATPPPTEVKTPTGLVVSINLTDNQKIPLTGYQIIMTPLNGQGASFAQAAIYINSTLVQTVTPAETGTATWQWIPAATGQEQISIIITDTNGATTTQNFTVDVTSQPIVTTQATTSSSPKAEPPKKGIAAVVQDISKATSAAVNKSIQFVKSLPAPIVHSFPYILFAVLAVDAVLLILQAERELQEYRRLQASLKKLQSLDEEKKTFTELVSHYLRTPLTILTSGVGILDSKKVLPKDVAKLSDITNQMQKKIEKIVNEAVTFNKSEYKDLNSELGSKVWKQKGLFIPILLICIIWFIFNYLVARAGKFSEGQVEQSVQALVFTLVIIFLYLVFRYLQLRRRDTIQMKHLFTDENVISEARDKLITDVAASIDLDIAQVDAIIEKMKLPPEVLKFIQAAQIQFHSLLTKFAVAKQLRGFQSDQPMVNVNLKDIINDAVESVQEQLTKKAVTISEPGDYEICVQEPELITYVLSSLLDNAIQFSQEKGFIEIAVNTINDESVITIIDHGIGISSSKLATLFHPFSRSDDVEEFSHEGMGFSLYLIKLIMTYLGGAIMLTSELNHGTTVTLHVPNQDLVSATQVIKPVFQEATVV